jgi:predicted dienelactone hydrolase
MRFFETALLLVDAVIILFLLTPHRPGWARFLPVAAIGIAVIHLVFEGYRWQMVPAYGVTSLLVLLSWRRPAPTPTPRRWLTGLWGGLSLLLLLVIAAPPLLFPVPVFPRPAGPYQVGTVSYYRVDEARDERYTPDPNDKRELMIQIWYPASPAPQARTGPWMNRMDVAGPIMANYIRLPGFVLDHANLVRTNSYPEATVASADAPFPVVIYSHGWNGFRTINTNQMEALASAGYVAVGIDHTYGAMVTVFPDGRVALNNPQALPDGAGYESASQILEATYAADIQFVMDELERLNASDALWANQLDLNRVGVFGHSTGGGAVVIACAQDARCKAGLGMDAWLEPVPETVIAAGLPQPFLFMLSEPWATGNNQPLLDRVYAGLQQGGYRMTIRGTRHYDFTLLPLLTPLAPALKLKGPIDGQRGMQIVTDYLLAFFDKHLKGESKPLLEGPSAAYPEVLFEQHRP